MGRGPLYQQTELGVGGGGVCLRNRSGFQGKMGHERAHKETVGGIPSKEIREGANFDLADLK